MKTLFPPIDPFKTEYLRVSDIHSLYLEQSGNPNGKPIISFHGGPGSQSKPDHRRFYDPAKYRIILFDQRGCGKSTPLGEIKENTTWDLVGDIEKIRKYLKIEKWIVQGGSWGSTLALAYAETYPQYIKALILRGIFTFRQWETDWFTKDARLFFPDRWEKAASILPPHLNQPVNDYLYDLYMGDNTQKQLDTIKSFNIWHRSLMTLLLDESKLEGEITKDAIAGEKIMHYYIKNNAFMKEGQLLDNAHLLKDIQTVIIQGRYDMCCPVQTAWELYKKMPHAQFFITPDAGHKSDEPGIMEKILEFTDKFSTL